MNARSYKLAGRSGQALISMLLIFLGLLALTGIGLDVALQVYARQKLQHTVDAAAIAGARQVGAGVVFATIVTDTQNHAVANAAAKGAAAGSTAFNATVVTDAQNVTRVTVNGSWTVRNVFGSLVGAAANTTIQCTSVAERTPVFIVLIADTSTSMNGAAMTDLKNAMNNFVARFIDNVDNFCLVSFGYTAKVDQPLAPLNKAALSTIINNLNLKGGTNYVDAFELASAQIQGANMPANAIVVTVFFSDGVPNTFTGFVTNVNGTPPTGGAPIPVNAAGVSTAKYTMWRDQSISIYPSVYAAGAQYPVGGWYPAGYPGTTLPQFAAPRTYPCAAGYPCPDAFGNNTYPDIPNGPPCVGPQTDSYGTVHNTARDWGNSRNLQGNCINDGSYQLSDGTAVAVPSLSDQDMWQRGAWDGGIIAANTLIKGILAQWVNSKVYSIFLQGNDVLPGWGGAGTAYTPDCLLSDIANDAASMATYCAMNSPVTNNLATYPAGEYRTAANSAQLDALFQQIADRITVRLT